MPQLIPIAATAIAIAAELPKGVILAIGLASSLVAGALSQALAPKPRVPKSLQQSGHLINTRNVQDPLPVVYGEVKVGGTHVFLGTTGSNNEYIHIVQTLSEGEIDSVVDIYLDDKSISEFGGYAYWEFFSGSATQDVCSTLRDALPQWNDPLKNTAYLYLRLKFSQDKFASFPTITATIKGRKVYDPRTGNTTWSDNPALCLYDFVTNTRYGVGIPAEFWDEESIKDAANWCEEKGYSFNAVVAEQETALDVVEKMLASFRGAIVWSEGKFKLIALDYDAPVMHLTEDDIKADSFQISVPGIYDTPNALRVKFLDKDANYVLNDFVLTDDEAVDLDGEIRDREVHLLGVTDHEQAEKMALYQLERQRLNKTYSFVAGPKAIPLEPGDLITVTHSLPGWDQKLVRVQSCVITGENEVALTVVEETELLYDDTLNVSTRTWHSSDLPDPLSTPPAVSNVTFEEEVYTIKNNSYVRVIISWDPPANYPWLDYVEVWLSRDGTNWTHETDASGSMTIEPVSEGDVLYVKLLSVNIYGVKMSLSDATTYTHEVTGKTELPADVQNFRALAAGDSVYLSWSPVDLEDLVGYEIRYGSAWSTGLPLAFVNGEGFVLSGVKPGTHSFAIKAKDSLGHYSENAAIVTVTVFDPPGYSEHHSWYNDFSSGTFDNTEAVDDPTYGRILRVKHSGGLSGSYTSPVYDMGSIKTERHWLEYETVVIAAGSAWEDQFGSDDLWTDVLEAGETWIQQFGNVAAGTLRMKLLYSEDNSNWYEVERLEILGAEVKARYVKHKVEIEDNSPESYVYVKPITHKAAYWQ